MTAVEPPPRNWGIVLGRSLLLLAAAAWLYFSVGGAIPRAMTVATTDGLRVELDVERLSIEQRQGLLSAIVSYGGLVEEK